MEITFKFGLIEVTISGTNTEIITMTEYLLKQLDKTSPLTKLAEILDELFKKFPSLKTV